MGMVVTSGRGRRWLETGHPWLFADDISSGAGAAGECVRVLGPDEAHLGWGLYSTASKIAVRLVTRDAHEPDAALWRARVERAIAVRARAGLLDPTGAERLVAGDAEGVPGLVVDRYADVLVLQSGCQGSDALVEPVAELVRQALPFPVRAVLERSDSLVRRLEHLAPRVRWLSGEAHGPIEVRETCTDGLGPLTYGVDVEHGHKTGHYLDMRWNRARAARLVRPGTRVLDLYSYDALFGVRAALQGADEVLCVDQSAAALERALAHARANGVAERVRVGRADVRDDLRARAERGERWDLVIVDPPAFARNRREAEGATRGYRELNRRAMQIVAEGGHLVSASCSFAVQPEEFVAILARASARAGRAAWLLELAGAGPDHPVLLTLPESRYLKCAFVRL
jgi:23S rRNA (cytosine1962-C5)-methyltransferase